MFMKIKIVSMMMKMHRDRKSMMLTRERKHFNWIFHREGGKILMIKFNVQRHFAISSKNWKELTQESERMSPIARPLKLYSRLHSKTILITEFVVLEILISFLSMDYFQCILRLFFYDRFNVCLSTTCSCHDMLGILLVLRGHSIFK